MVKLWGKRLGVPVAAELILLFLLLLILYGTLKEGSTTLDITMTIMAFIALSANSLQIISTISALKETKILTDQIKSTEDIGSLRDSLLVNNRKSYHAKKLAESVLEIIKKYGSVTNFTKDDVDEIVGKCNELQELFQDISNVSTSSENLASIMKDTADTSENIAAATLDIAGSAQNITDRTSQGVQVADEISERARDINNRVVESQHKAQQIFSEVKLELENAIDEAKIVEQISILSDSIIKITAQTNLLALNANIEAAKAGDAGGNCS